MTPTQRSLALLRQEGYVVQKVEFWNAFARRRVDLFGVIDILAIRADMPGVLGVQTTTGDNAAARIAKAKEQPALSVWLKAGNKFIVHAWAKRGGRGERKLWTCVRRELSFKEM